MDANDEFQITPEELERIKSAMNNKIFRDMLIEYANEISDPINKKKYEDEIIAMERQRGHDVKLMKPQSGFVVKTVRLKDNLKTFINICTSPEVGEYSSEKGIQNGLSGLHVKLPHSLVPHRKDYDKAGKQCIVYDVCFNPKSYERALQDEAFRSILIDTSFDAIEKQADTSFDRKNKKFPKMKYKGTPQPSILRSTDLKQRENKETSNLDFNYPTRNIEKKNSKNVKKNSELNLNENSASTKLPMTPKFNIIHRGFFDMQDFTNTNVCNNGHPKELVVEIYLPLADTASGIDLDIFEKQLVLNSNNPSYHLDIALPYKINDNLGCAQFDKSKRILFVTLPVISEPNIHMDTKSSLVTFADENKSDLVTNPIEGIKKDQKNVVECNETRKYDEENTEVLNLTPMNEHTENLKFDLSVLDYLPGTSQLPPFSYHQTSEEILVSIAIQDIKVENLSIGFTEHQVYVSFSQNSDEKTLEWSMVVRSEDKDFFDKSDCGFDISPDGLELHLRKLVSSIGLWDRIFIGASETELKMEFFLTEKNSESLTKFNLNDINPKSLCENNSLEHLKNVTMERLENHLEKLLVLQDTVDFDDNVFNDQGEDQDEVILDKRFVKTELNGSCSESSVPVDNDDLNINLMDLHDDVIDSSPCSSPCSPYQVCRTNTRFFTRHVYDCSPDKDTCQRNAMLKSILKRSKSDDTDYESAKTSTNRTRAMTMSDTILFTSQDDVYKRRRYKSVTFSEEPIVFEFDKLSKRQWKKKAKLEKQREGSDTKPDNLLCSVRILSSPAISPVSVPHASVKVNKKQSKKAKRREKRNSTSSTSDKELDSEELRKKSKKKKKKKVTNVHLGNTSVKCHIKTEKENSSLDNQMIFDLE